MKVGPRMYDQVIDRLTAISNLHTKATSLDHGALSG